VRDEKTGKILRLHPRTMRKIFLDSDYVFPPDLATEDVQDPPDLQLVAPDHAPVTEAPVVESQNVRPRPASGEIEFSSDISNSTSRYGRVRRGSMIV
jgi:hypothetical protein